MRPANKRLAVLLLVMAGSTPTRAQTTLNLSHDLTTLGIASENMVPNQPSLDSGPLFVQALEYAKTHGITNVIADTGAYYILSEPQPFVSVQINQLSNLTIDFQGSDIYFAAVNAGFQFTGCSNLVVENFTIDRLQPGYTQLQVTSVDPTLRQINFTVQPGWQKPTALNSLLNNPAIIAATPAETDLFVFRNGRLWENYTTMPVQQPFNDDHVVIGSNGFVTSTILASIRPGDIAVLRVRVGLNAIIADCSSCTFRNIRIYSGMEGFDLSGPSSSTVLERVYVMPKPGTDRLVSTQADGITVTQPGANNTVRLSRAIRTLDDGISPHVWVWGFVQTVVAPQTALITATGITALGQFRPLPVLSNVAFQRSSDGAILGTAVVTSESSITTVNGVNQVTVTFDRDLPADVAGTYIYSTDPSWRGDGLRLERNTVQEQAFARGVSLWGLVNATVTGSYLHRTAMSGIHLSHSLSSVDWLTPPLIGTTITNNVIDGSPTEIDGNALLEFAAVEATGFASNITLMPTSPNQNLTFTRNFVANAARSAFYVGNTTGATVADNYLLHPNRNPRQDRRTGQNAADFLKPIAIENSVNVSTTNNPVDTTSGQAWVTDTQSRELAAYAPGATVRLNAYGIGTLVSPTITLTDGDGVTRSMTIQATAAHALDVQLPAAAALGGAYVTLTSGTTKFFGTLFVDMQDNVPALNGCVYEVGPSSTTVPASAGALPVLVVTQPGCAYQVTASDSWVTPGSGTNTSVVSVGITANTGVSRTATIEIAGQPFTITQTGFGPTMEVDRSALTFTTVNSGTSFVAATAPQSVRLTQLEPGTVTWTATSNQPWLTVSPASGSGGATLTVSPIFVAGLAPTQTGAITIAFTGTVNTPGPITVTLNSIAPGTSAVPFGSFDSPTNGATGVAGSIAVTGWALDDVAVTRVTVCRDAAVGEIAPLDPNCAGTPLIYVGDAVFVDGARPDVQAAFPTLPLNSRAGWGYLLLTNFLPNLGNGTFNLRVFAFDAEGHSAALGVKTITCDNADAVAPFGAIDVPAQGATVSGVVGNVGWVLARGPNHADPPSGGTVNVFVDGTNVGAPGAWNHRPDLDALFSASAYPGISSALGIFGLDTTTLTNGVHTIFWIVTGTGGGTSGIGSRFFTVSNGSSMFSQNESQARALKMPAVIPSNPALDAASASASRISSTTAVEAEVAAAPVDAGSVQGRRGFDLDRALHTYTASDGRIDVQSEELDRIELHLGGPGNHRYRGYLHTPDGLRPLPVGSSLNTLTGEFTWMPGVGFYGPYDLTFVRWSNGRAVARQDVRITLNAKGSNRVGPQTIIDAPGPGQVLRSEAFFVGGWAADVDSTVDTGVNTVHVWAYPIDATGKALDPVFLGPAIYGGDRPDVAAVYGERFAKSGYGLIVNTLPPGTYDIAVFAYSSVVNNFTPAKVVRVVVR